MPDLALITCLDLPEPDPDQDLLLDALRCIALIAGLLPDGQNAFRGSVGHNPE